MERQAEYEKRSKSFLAKTRENKLIKGFGRIEKYYNACANVAINIIGALLIFEVI